MTEDELLFKLKRNDNTAFRTVYKECLPMVVKHIRLNNGNTEDAEDLFQEALIVLIRKLQEPGFELSSKLSSYLFSIVKKNWLYKLRGKKTWVEGGEVIEGIADDSPDEILQKQEKKWKAVRFRFCMLPNQKLTCPKIQMHTAKRFIKKQPKICKSLLISIFYFKMKNLAIIFMNWHGKAVHKQD